ncbi:hypothetical protein Pmani_000774 [Petrolisthes manimaculis]|uniref:Calcium-activated chloride channel N-terminal domain-containing protein n=1 Tax=Petrolisthes manimaculis TaxID=1843537 RepID=A0AAE1UM04_9EUCA|nr:hypothetical protein Pmani_000774 [Petrolisthes manimaculis]
MERIEAALDSFSRGLWLSTDGKVYLGEVKVVVPSQVLERCSASLTTTTTQQATWHRWANADLTVSPGISAAEWSLMSPEGSLGVSVDQPQGCGKPGDHITLDAHLLQELDQNDLHTLGRSLVSGWARYRWGVFEERGYKGHLRHPPAHLQDDTLLPTSCSNAPTKGHWTSKKGSGKCGDDPEHDTEDCIWVPDSSAQVNTSLLYRTNLPQISKFCDATNHDPDSPTPHNLLCEARSVWEVMRQHSDFASTHHKHVYNQYTYPKHGANPNDSSSSLANPPHQSLNSTSNPGTPSHSESPSHSLTSSPSLSSTSPSHPPYSLTSHYSSDSDHPHPFPTSINESLPHQANQDRTSQTHPLFPSNHNIARTSSIGSVSRGSSIHTQNPSSTENITEEHNTSNVYSGERISASEVTYNGDGLFSDETKRKNEELILPQNRSEPSIPHKPSSPGVKNLKTAVKGRKKRMTSSMERSTETAKAPEIPSLVMAHIATPSSVPLAFSDTLEATNMTASNITNGSTTFMEDITTSHRYLGDESIEMEVNGFEFDFLTTKTPESTKHNHHQPPPLDMVLVASPPNAVILALDLSDAAIAQVNLEEVRGGVLRWLWGLGVEMRVGVLAAYHNASYPLTLGPPLPPAPTTASRLEDEVALLPSQAEVQAGVYGGHYCLECVLDEAAKMLEDGGVTAGSGVLLVTACSPIVTPAHLTHPALSSLAAIHTLALCPTTSPLFDQLAVGTGQAWVLPGTPQPSPPAADRTGQVGEQWAGKVFTAATQTTFGTPTQSSLVLVGQWEQKAGIGQVESSGPYSIVSGFVTLPSAPHLSLLIITTLHHAKVVELRDPSGTEVDLVRDTNQRFWAVIGAGSGGLYSYTTKFLTTSIHFPLSINLEVYERRNEVQPGILVTLNTNSASHVPLEPGSPPLVVWAQVTQGGRPVVGAKVTLIVTHLSHDGPTHMTVELLDNGNAEPDVRAQDGVYTRYVTWLPGEGRYSLTAIATDHQGAASVLTPRRRDGRMVPVSAGQFEESSASLALTVARVTSADLVPPSRVTDLAVTHVHNTTVNLTWSAPGGDLDQGSAWRYELKMYTERGTLSEERFNTSTIAVYCIAHDLRAPTQTPAPYGTPQHCLTELPFTNLRWYFAIRAVDVANNTGRISNIVSAFVPDPPTPSPSLATAGGDSLSSVQTVIMSTISSPQHPGDYNRDTQTPPTVRGASYDWRVWVAVGVAVGGILVAGVVVLLCVCCCRRGLSQGHGSSRVEKEPDRPVYKIYVNNAYIQEDDGEIKVVSNGKLVDEKEPSQVQEWVNSLSKFGSNDLYSDGNDPNAGAGTTTDAPLVECRPRSSVKYATSPVRFGVLTNGSIMRENCPSASSTSSSKPSEDQSGEDLIIKYRDLSETTSNSTTDGGASAASTATTDTTAPPPPPPPLPDIATRAGPQSVHPNNINNITNNDPLPPPPPPSQLIAPQPLGIPGPTVVSIHSGLTLNNTGYSSDEEGGFRPRTAMGRGPGPRKYLPTQFSSFRYLPPPPEYRSGIGGSGSDVGGCPLNYPTCHTISRATAATTTLPHGTVRSVKKRRHISFV